MLPDEPLVSKDKYGCDVIILEKKHLEDFPALIQWIREKGYGADTGLVKLQLSEKDREDSRCLDEIIKLLNDKFQERAINAGGRRKAFVYNPDVQMFFKASIDEDIYQYTRAECSSSERKQFVRDATLPSLYKEPMVNCCTKVLEFGGLQGLRKHSFDQIRNVAPYTGSLIEKETQRQELLGGESRLQHTNVASSRVVYGAGISLGDTPIKICGDFTLSRLNTVIDMLEEEYDGIAFPYLYCGSSHTFFPWHIEDGGMFSINYVVAGKPKVWYGYPPNFFGLIDCIAQSFNIDKGHTACRALMADHKALIFDPECLKERHGVLYSTVIQEPGDFVITLPFALHSGMNLGQNIAVAANFGDPQWIEQGIYAPICTCNPTQVHLNLSNLIKSFKPELLDSYLQASGSLYPPNHPREVRRILDPPPAKQNSSTSVSIGMQSSQGSAASEPSINKEGRRNRTLHCPECHQSFQGNKMLRLFHHIKVKHPSNEDTLREVVKIKYPPWQPKTSDGFTCTICGVFRRGSSAHLKQHHKKDHADLPFCGGLKG